MPHIRQHQPTDASRFKRTNLWNCGKLNFPLFFSHTCKMAETNYTRKDQWEIAGKSGDGYVACAGSSGLGKPSHKQVFDFFWITPSPSIIQKFNGFKQAKEGEDSKPRTRTSIEDIWRCHVRQKAIQSLMWGWSYAIDPFSLGGLFSYYRPCDILKIIVLESI